MDWIDNVTLVALTNGSSTVADIGLSDVIQKDTVEFWVAASLVAVGIISNLDPAPVSFGRKCIE